MSGKKTSPNHHHQNHHKNQNKNQKQTDLTESDIKRDQMSQGVIRNPENAAASEQAEPITTPIEAPAASTKEETSKEETPNSKIDQQFLRDHEYPYPTQTEAQTEIQTEAQIEAQKEADDQTTEDRLRVIAQQFLSTHAQSFAATNVLLDVFEQHRREQFDKHTEYLKYMIQQRSKDIERFTKQRDDLLDQLQIHYDRMREAGLIDDDDTIVKNDDELEIDDDEYEDEEAFAAPVESAHSSSSKTSSSKAQSSKTASSKDKGKSKHQSSKARQV